MSRDEELQILVSDEQINNAWGNANFGEETSKRGIIANGLLKYACGYHSGYTLQSILKQLGLLTIQLSLTKKGKEYLFTHYSNGLSV